MRQHFLRIIARQQNSFRWVSGVSFFFISLLVSADEIKFERDIAPILKERCIDCHGEAKEKSGLRLDTRANMLRGGDSGLAAVIPGNPEKSYLLEVVKHLDPDVMMPPDEDRIPAKEIHLLERWIKAGSIWPGQMATVEEMKSDHWSFQAIRRPDSPEEYASHSNPIDRFLLKRLDEDKLTFSDPAVPRSLIRRVSIVLTGLPPTLAETKTFLAAYEKDSDEAYELLVDRLLDSAHFGERWAQHWLDVIRWAETNGSESNMYRKNAWIYRDYVMRALNEDKPYDRFLFEQIAGDSVGQGDATGFLVAGPHVPVATVGQEPAARRQARADRMDEIIQTVGASALGVTIGCARCHNHKFDPISIRDYYAMTAVFEDVEFGSRFPELAADHPRRLRGQELYGKIRKVHAELKPMGPWVEDWVGYKELHFDPVKAQKVRIKFNWGGVRLDEIEIFGPTDHGRNVAAASEGTQTFSPPEMAIARADLKHVNDGKYGTQAWGAKAPADGKSKPWIEFTFTQPHDIERIRLSTNREDFFETAYLEGLNKFNFGPYRVEIPSEEGQWKQIASTMTFDQQNKKHTSRKGLLTTLQELITLVNEEGPKPSFVARFIKPVDTHILMRGSPENPRDEVLPAGLSQLGGDLNLRTNASGPKRRAAFAQWLIKPSNPLVPRVAVNRIWHHVFGQGIVTTTSDFGAAGTPPTHPGLLEWLAAEFMQPASRIARSNETQAWSIKHMIRLMVMSDAFRQSSAPGKEGITADADSQLLWRYPPKRVEAEVIRDSILQASDTLDRTIGGRSYRIHNVKKRYAQWKVTDNHGSETWRRMIYQERMRRVDDQMFTAFDFPDCGQVRAKRPVSTTPLQALNLMNSDFVMDQSSLIAERARQDTNDHPELAIQRCFELLLGRPPTIKEQASCLDLVREKELQLVCRAIINSNEFAFLP
ncbi:MAG: DUF1553 domain-containing protein [Verrucomicrobia bacterium]|nr:DUF1553 domain-containing protein [Verrucomicrobiota bacterium]